MSQAALLVMWIAFTAVALAGLVAVLVWAVRSRQFSDQDRARYLPLDGKPPAGEPPDAAPPRAGEPKD